MKDKRVYRYFACDFETTVFPEGQQQDSTEVWASACVEIGLTEDDVHVFHSIKETWEYFKSLKSNLICYYHNLKFDGSFWLNFLYFDLKFEPAATVYNETLKYQGTKVVWKDRTSMYNNTFAYHISADGMWYYIIIKVKDKIIELRDSYKLIPFSIKRIGKDFHTKHKKLDMEYIGKRYAGCEITEKEKEYIANDVLVLKEALEFMFENGHKKLTIGSCCLSEFKHIATDLPCQTYKDTFPDMYDMPLKLELYGANSVGQYIWRSYRGGWCYLKRGKENIQYNKGVTIDVNSLYPYVMHSSSGNRYPYGKPHFWSGNFIPQDAIADNRYFFIRIKTRFYLKKDYLPFMQIKGSMFYKATECLEDSDRRDLKTGEKMPYVIGFNKEIEDTRLTLTLTMIDFELLKEHYNLIDFEILDGCWFNSVLGIFDSYINKYMDIKKVSKGALRTLAKLFLNNLYGKMAASTDSSFKYAYIKAPNLLGFYRVTEFDRTPGYIPIGSAITSYARNYTIRTAQRNYKNFIYADTDSLHCEGDIKEIKGARIHHTDLGAWDLETQWDNAIFARQKTYIEHVTHEGYDRLDEAYYNIKCAGMPEQCKNIFIYSLDGKVPKEAKEKLLLEQKKFLYASKEDYDNDIVIKRTIKDFKKGLTIYGKLLPKMIEGGVLLTTTTYQML